MTATDPTAALKLARDALAAALQYHGVMLLSDPPQDAWKFHRVSERIATALAAIDALPASVPSDPNGRLAAKDALIAHQRQHIGDLKRLVDHYKAKQASVPSGEPADFDAEGFRAWVAKNLPDDTIIGSGAYWADHLTEWAKRFAARGAAPTAQAPQASGEPAVRCELVESCRKCRHAVGRQSCALARRDIEGAGIPDWCPLPAYRATAQAAPAPAPWECSEPHKPADLPMPTMAAMLPCKGMNCGCTDGRSHSLECHAEHAAAIAGGTFVPAQAAPAPAPTVAELVAIELERLAQDPPISGNTLAQTRVLMTAANVREFGLAGDARTQAPAVAAPEPQRAALAQAGAGREPVAEVRRAHYGGRARNIGVQVCELLPGASVMDGTKLYAHPPPAQREPLSDAQMLACVRSVGVPAPMGLTRDRGPYEVTEPTWFLIQLVRAIERANGITTSGTKGAA